MSCFTIQNIINSLKSCLKEIKNKDEALHLTTKVATNDMKTLLAQRKTISVSSSSATALDSALCGDGIVNYEKLRTDTEETIQNINSVFSQLVKCTRKQKAVALLDKTLDSSLPPECVFVSKFVPRSRNRIHREQFQYVASCVRVGGEYAVAMRRRKNKNNQDCFIFNKEDDKVFPLKSRDEFVIDGSYPLMGFEDDAYGNTHAIFLTGLALGVKLPKKVPAAEPNSGLHDIVIKRYRVAKIPVLCLFDTPDTIATTIFVRDEENSVIIPATQPMDEHELWSEALDTELENQKTADASPEVEQRVNIYDCGPKKTPLFSLTAIQVDEIKNSWCNPNSIRCVKSGGFSGEKDGVDAREMNDISCFSDCIDISDNTWENFNCCVTIEPGRRLFEASSVPFTRLDAMKYEINSAPITTSFVDNDDGSSSSLSDICGEEAIKRNTTPRGICTFKINNPQEVTVLEKLIDWSEKKKFDNLREAVEDDCKNSWWCSYSPPLKVEEEEEEEEPEAKRCVETEAAVKTAYMTNRLTLEQEVVPFLQNIIHSSLGEGRGDKPPCSIQIKLKRSLQELEENVARHSSIWSTQSIETARALMMDEAYAASVAHQITHRITSSGVFERMCISDTRKDDVYQGQRKYVSGLKMVNVSAMKQDGEREIDAALKEWIKSKLSPVPSFLTSSYSTSVKGEKKRGTSFSVPAEKEQEPPRKKIIKEDENGSPLPCSTTFDHKFADLVGIIPPSFVKMPRINMKRFTEDLADSLGRALCGMKNPAHVYQNICAVVVELRERLLIGPFKRFSACPEFEHRLFDTVKAKDVEQNENNVSVLDYESERLGKLLLKAKKDWKFYQRFSDTFEKSYSWNMGIENHDEATKIAIIASTLRKVYEEYYAFEMLVNMFIFDKLKKELEGHVLCKNISLAAAFNWYCTVVARNRICDAFRYIVKPNHNSETYRHFYENLTNNKIVISGIMNKIIDSLRWIMNTEIPSGYLKGLLDNTTTIAETEARKSGVRRTPCETIDETAKFVVPSLKIIDGPAKSEKSVRIGSHIAGPIFVNVDFREIGLDRVKYGKLFVNTVTGNGLLTASPNYDITEEEKDSIFPDHDLISFISLNTKSLPTFLAAPSHPNGGASKGGNAIFDIRSFQSINITTTTTTTTGVATSAQKPWIYDKMEQSENMWRCGFVIPKKLCDIIFNNRKSVKIIASPSKKSKTTSTVADSCIRQDSKGVEKVCKALATFTVGSSKILAKNLVASSPTKIDVEIYRRGDSSPIATCLMVHEECKKQLHFDNYSNAFFNFKCKSLRFRTDEEEEKNAEEQTKEVDSLCFFNALQSLRGTANQLHILKNKHLSNITSFRKKKPVMEDAVTGSGKKIPNETIEKLKQI